MEMQRNKSAVDRRISELQDGNPAVRTKAARELGFLFEEAGRNNVLKAVPALIKALSDSDSGVRMEAAWTLGIIRDGHAVAPLTRALDDKDAGVRKNAAWALEQINGPPGESESVMPEPIKKLADEDPDVRLAAVRSLPSETRLSYELRADALANVLFNRDERSEIRIEAAKALSKLGGGAATKALIDGTDIADIKMTDNEQARERYSNQSVEIRVECIKILGEMNYRDAIPTLIRRLKNNSPKVRAEAAMVLGNLKAMEAKDGLTDMLFNDPDTAAQNMARDALMKLLEGVRIARTEGKLAQKPQQRFPEGSGMTISEENARVLMKIGTDEALSILRQDPDAYGSALAWSYTLTKLGGKEAAELLGSEALKTGTKVKLAAALAFWGNRTGMKFLIALAEKATDPQDILAVSTELKAIAWKQPNDIFPLAKSRSASARQVAAFALGGVTTEDGVKAIISLLDDPDLNVRLNAAESLARLYMAADLSLSSLSTMSLRALEKKVAKGDIICAVALANQGALKWESTSLLRTALSDRNPSLRRAAVSGLAESVLSGDFDRYEALGILDNMQKDKDPNVASEARSSKQRLKPSSAPADAQSPAEEQASQSPDARALPAKSTDQIAALTAPGKGPISDMFKKDPKLVKGLFDRIYQLNVNRPGVSRSIFGLLADQKIAAIFARDPEAFLAQIIRLAEAIPAVTAPASDNQSAQKEGGTALGKAAGAVISAITLEPSLPNRSVTNPDDGNKDEPWKPLLTSQHVFDLLAVPAIADAFNASPKAVVDSMLKIIRAAGGNGVMIDASLDALRWTGISSAFARNPEAVSTAFVAMVRSCGKDEAVAERAAEAIFSLLGNPAVAAAFLADPQGMSATLASMTGDLGPLNAATIFALIRDSKDLTDAFISPKQRAVLVQGFKSLSQKIHTTYRRPRESMNQDQYAEKLAKDDEDRIWDRFARQAFYALKDPMLAKAFLSNPDSVTLPLARIATFFDAEDIYAGIENGFLAPARDGNLYGQMLLSDPDKFIGELSKTDFGWARRKLPWSVIPKKPDGPDQKSAQ